ncbi:21.7 kDa class VI heat shock protein [Andrographis paniculata]|uniref:21.7 kDa class VI heat shock protein n=1 Tax=Andrographis paniculata TaxID=175694 RepID=UPI0021E88E9D|nr:21.7 kDa class VI heat shock protein [Andrographis paniculata]
MTSSSSKPIEIHCEDPSPKKWSHPLKEDVLAALMTRDNSLAVCKPGSLFNPLLFGKFFDPSDAFPLWEFDSDALLPNSGQRVVDWGQTETDYVLRAEFPGLGFNSGLHICVENGKILEISAQWRESRANDWRNNHWWEHGGVRRIELPENADWRKAEARLQNDVVLEIRIPKTTPPPDAG